MKKKILSILLSVAVAIAMIPATGAVAFAESSLYVGGQLISADGTPVDMGGGTVSYNGEILTLDNVNLDYDLTDPYSAIDFDDDLIIETKGSCSINSDSYGIRTTGNLEIAEGSSLEINSFAPAIEVTVDPDLEDTEEAINSGNVINNGTIKTVSTGYGINCNNLTNNGSISCDALDDSNYPDAGVVATTALVNNGTIQCKNSYVPVAALKIVQNDGTIEAGGAFSTAMECLNFIQTGGTINIANSSTCSNHIDGISITDSERGTFDVSGGNLNINLSADAAGSRYGINASVSGFHISGGNVNVSVGNNAAALGVVVTGAKPIITGGCLTVSVDADVIEGSTDDLSYVTIAYVESELSAEPEMLTESEELSITASNNPDGSSPVAYDPAKVIDGYKYLQVLHKHSWDSGVVTAEPTCTEPGTKTFTCVACKETKTEEIAATGHTSVAIAAKKATTTADGVTAGTKCSVCGKVLTAPKTIYKASTVKLAAASKVYTGKALKPAVTIKDSKGNKVASANYSVKYANNTKVGKATATVTFQNNYEGTKKLTFKINPKKAAVKSAVPGKKSLKVTAGTKVAATGGDKYKIAYKVNGTSTWKYKTTANKTLTIKSLKKGKKYQVKIQAIKTVNNVTYKGAWSAVKTTNKIK